LKKAKDITDWLTKLEMEKYSPVFIKEDMYKDLLPDLDEKILDRMGITTTGHRVKILKAVKTLKGEIASQKTPVVPQPSVQTKPTHFDLEQELQNMKFINKSGSWILHNSELEFTVKLGSGASGTVYKGLYKGKEMAIKVLKTEQTQKELEEFKKEFQIMSAIQSPYIVFFFGAVLEPKMCMVMELCSRGSLYHVMSDPKVELGWDLVFSSAKEMVKGVECLHSYTPQVLHRDFKSLNLMVTEQWHIKVGDFGLSRFNTDTQKETLAKMRGTFAYCAPEVYFGEKFTTKADVFSIAIVLWELVTRAIKLEYERPYQEYPNLHFDFQIIIQTAKKGLRPTVPETCPPAFADLIRTCWAHEAEKRLHCSQVSQALEELEKDYHQRKADWEKAIEPPKPQPVTPPTTQQ